MNELVTIIVPIYKVERFLHKCVKSILQQTYDNIEIILINDGSPDSCGQICDNYAAIDRRIRVIHQNNKGLSEARNRGIVSCKGDYIIFVDGDDYIEPNTVERLLHECIKNGADVCCCGHFKEYTSQVKPYPLTVKEKCYEGLDVLISAMDGGVFRHYAWNKIWKRELFDDCLFPPGMYFEDIATTWKLFQKCNRVVCIPDLLFHYVARKDSIGNTKNMKNLTDRWIAFKERFDSMDNMGGEIQQICVVKCLDTIAYTWRWLYVVDEKERDQYTLSEMRTFLKMHVNEIHLCPLTTRIALFCAMHSNRITIFCCYYLNMIYRKTRRMEEMI